MKRLHIAGRTGRVALISAAGLVLAAGIAYASTPGAAQIYTACMLKSDGTLRLISPALGVATSLGHCKASEKKVTWGQAGAAGPAGPAGPAGAAGGSGATGATGPAGTATASLPDAYYSGTVGGTTTNLSTSPAAVASLSLPAGKFMVYASARLASQGTGTNADCFLQPTGGGTNSGYANVNLGGSSDRKFIALSYPFTLSGSTTLALKCEISSGGAAGADEEYLSAIAVGSVS